MIAGADAGAYALDAAGAAIPGSPMQWIAAAKNIGQLVGSFGGGGGPAGFTGLDVSGEASLSGFTGGQFFGNSRNSQEAFRWASHDHNATGQLSSVISSEFSRLSAAASKLGADASVLSSAKVPFQFTVTKAGQPSGAGPTTAEIVGDFQSGVLPKISDQIARALVPGVSSASELFALADNPGAGAGLRRSVGAGPVGGAASLSGGSPAGVPRVLIQSPAAASSGGDNLLAWLTLIVGALALKG